MARFGRVDGSIIEGVTQLNKRLSVVVILVAGWFLPGLAAADLFVGYFTGDLDGRHYRVTIDSVAANTYDGILQVDDERMQLDARRYGELLGGRLADESRQMGFRARLEGGILILETEDGRRVVLRRGNPE